MTGEQWVLSIIALTICLFGRGAYLLVMYVADLDGEDEMDEEDEAECLDPEEVDRRIERIF